MTTRHRLLRRLAVVLPLVAVTAVGVGGSALAAFPGANDRIAFVQVIGDTTIIAGSDGGDVFTITGTGENPDGLGDGNPSFSPGGSLVVFARYDAAGNGDLWQMTFDGGQQTRLTTGAWDDDWAGWSPDGARIVFASNRAGQYEIYSMKLNGTDLKRLTFHSSIDFEPAWSPNNDAIAFRSLRDGTARIYLMDPDGTNVRPLLTNPVGEMASPTWSPDGTQIAFTRFVDETHADIQRVVVGQQTQVCILCGGVDYNPAWSPDGTSITYTSGLTPSDIKKTTIASPSPVNLTSAVNSSTYQADWRPIPEFPLSTRGSRPSTSTSSGSMSRASPRAVRPSATAPTIR